MNSYLKLIVFAITAFFIVTPARAGWHVKYFEGRNQSADDIERQIGEWINNEGKPKDINSIKGFISQSLTGDRGGNYNVFVYCDSADEGRPSIQVRVTQYTWLHNSEADRFIPTLEQNHGKVVLLGFYGGRTAHSIFYVYQAG